MDRLNKCLRTERTGYAWITAVGAHIVTGSVLWFGATAIMAAGLGPLTVRTSLGQPLIAEVELVTAGKRDTGMLTARIASNDAHRRAGVANMTAAFGLRAAIQTRQDGISIVRIESLKPVTEPVLTLLIELAGPDIQTQREYPVLLQPPELPHR